MNSNCNRKGALVFVLIPVVFNVLIWQNYTTCAECLLPGCLRCCNSTLAFLTFGLAFGAATALFARLSLASVLSIFSVSKNQTIKDHLLRRRTLYANAWVVAFTLASFAGFVFMIAFRPAAAAVEQIYFNGMQGYMLGGMTGGVCAILAMSVLCLLWNGALCARRAMTQRF